MTFYYNKKQYAIEIETGNLLKKKDQLDEKIKHLNRKYRDSWLVIVSHRDLVPKYRKFGLTSDRKNARKTLERLLNSHTQI